MKVLLFLFSLVPGMASAALAEQRLAQTARYIWSDPSPAFGGLSGIEVIAEGTKLVAISDRGVWIMADIDRDANGNLTAARLTGMQRVLGVNGERLSPRLADSEGLAIDDEGRAYVSFESQDRVWRYDQIGGRPTPLPDYADFHRLAYNLGLEAVAVDHNGTVYALPERTRRVTPKVPVYRFRDGEWDQTEIRRGEGFYEVDADFGPDGRLYVLERRFKWLSGFATRLRSFAPEGDGFTDERILLNSRFGEMDNMEGVSVWRDPEGQTRITLVSDDNFFPLQRTYLLEFTLLD